MMLIVAVTGRTHSSPNTVPFGVLLSMLSPCSAMFCRLEALATELAAAQQKAQCEQRESAATVQRLFARCVQLEESMCSVEGANKASLCAARTE